MAGKVITICLIMISLSACSDTVPQVDYLILPSKPKVADKSFVQSGISANQSITTSDGYRSQVLIHSGAELKKLKTSDNYSLEIRSLSF
ncbi:hypothetical protein [Bdellovibrio reynosensis]|uniref:Uncharacterized protein n=1 Tax=Bdellovibrio reynosensis TaxID=2835041 RepID=A0ABY4CDT5_9BACT|nr:hypothetical protein [Bdellovibrio reynosensis]UOF02624.1 hypothetical protein MNR06_06635 [Bdellovibrio reynosensis]